MLKEFCASEFIFHYKLFYLHNQSQKNIKCKNEFFEFFLLTNPLTEKAQIQKSLWSQPVFP
jgi:hypothetical protein